MGSNTVVSENSDAQFIAASVSTPAQFSATFERYVHDVARFDISKSSAKPWLFGIANNVLRHHYRAKARDRRLLRHGHSQLIHQLASLDPGGSEATASIDAKSLEIDIAHSLAQLRSEWREEDVPTGVEFR
jgi:RNA polymerase sigma-70 factor (ECF subfamily)